MFTNLNRDILESQKKKPAKSYWKELVQRISCKIIRDPFYMMNMAIFDHLHENNNYSRWYNTPYKFKDITTRIDLPLPLNTKEQLGIGKVLHPTFALSNTYR